MYWTPAVRPVEKGEKVEKACHPIVHSVQARNNGWARILNDKFISLELMIVTFLWIGEIC